MSRIEAYRHLLENRPGTCCASAVLHALSPVKPLETTTQAVLGGDALTLTEIAACIAFEHQRKGDHVIMHHMSPRLEPSFFFRNMQRQIEQEGNGKYFIGGLMATLEHNNIWHVIGVLGHHHGNQNMFTVCDTSRMRAKGVIRRITYREMDARIISPQQYTGSRAMSLMGQSLEAAMQDPQYHGNLSTVYRQQTAVEATIFQMLNSDGMNTQT